MSRLPYGATPAPRCFTADHIGGNAAKPQGSNAGIIDVGASLAPAVIARLDRASQYFRNACEKTGRLGGLNHPLAASSRVMTTERGG